MTDQENTLPTAAKWVDYSKMDEFGEEADLMRVNAAEVKFNHRDELVRRKDVEKLIEDKIDQFNEGRPPEYPQVALKEVLDEVENQ